MPPREPSMPESDGLRHYAGPSEQHVLLVEPDNDYGIEPGLYRLKNWRLYSLPSGRVLRRFDVEGLPLSWIEVHDLSQGRFLVPSEITDEMMREMLDADAEDSA